MHFDYGGGYQGLILFPHFCESEGVNERLQSLLNFCCFCVTTILFSLLPTSLSTSSTLNVSFSKIFLSVELRHIE